MAALSLPARRTALPRTVLARAGADAEDMNTTSNLAIVDGYGNALAMTTTINTHWGAHIEAAGMMLNNAMSNFSAGTPGIDVNGYAANKRAAQLDRAGAGVRRVRQAPPGVGLGRRRADPRLHRQDVPRQRGLRHGHPGGDQRAELERPGRDRLGANFEPGTPIAGLIPGMRTTYGYTATTLSATGLTSGLSGIAVEYDGYGFPVYHGAADNRRAGGANGY